MRKTTRLLIVVAALGGMVVPVAAEARDWVSYPSCTTSDIVGAGEPGEGSPPALRDAADHHGMRIGAALNSSFAQRGPQWEVVARELNHLTPENQLKWYIVHPELNEYEFCYADTIVKFAQANGQTIHGTTMIWGGVANPPWLRYGKSGTCEDAYPSSPCVPWSRDEMLGFLRDHIFTVMRHYRDNFPGVITEWEIANEVIADCEAQPCDYDVQKSAFCPSGPCPMRDTIWSRWIGDDYLDLAFRYAREADPNVKLYLNDYWIETPGNKPKLDALLNLVAGMKSRGVPIDGIGFQSHINVFDGFLEPKDFPTREYLVAALQRAADLDVDVAITEIDVSLNVGGPLTPEMQGSQAEVYGVFMDSCLAQARCRTFIMWGTDDGNSWLRPDQPLIYSALYQEKMAYHALRSSLLEATSERIGESFVRNADQYRHEGSVVANGTGQELRDTGSALVTTMPLSGRSGYEATIVARGVPHAGVWPEFDLQVDGATVGHVVVDSPSFTSYKVPFVAEAGSHDFKLVYTNGHRVSDSEGRALVVQTISAVAPVDAEHAHTRTSGGVVGCTALPSVAAAPPVGRGTRSCWSMTSGGRLENSFVTERRDVFDVNLPAHDVVLLASGTLAPVVEVRIDGVAVGTITITSAELAPVRLTVSIAPGVHDIALVYTNPAPGRTLTIDRYSVESTAG